jgi:hypothetical protein
MAVGKQLGEFALKATSLTYTATETGGSIQGNFEGTAKGEGLTGPVLGTLTSGGAPGAKSGTCSWVGTSYLDNGEETHAKGEGTWESIGTHKWRIRGINYLSDGRTVASDGEIVLATRSFTGTLFEWS